MLLKDYPVVLPDYILTLEELSPESCLFFDICNRVVYVF